MRWRTSSHCQTPMLDSKKQTKGNAMKVLKVTMITTYGDESEMEFSIGESIPEEMYVVSILKGITNAKSVIRSFEIVEV